MNPKIDLFYDSVPSPLGPLWLVSAREGLSFLSRERTETDFLSDIHLRTGVVPEKRPRKLDRWRLRLERYFSGERIDFDLPFHCIGGTDFQKKIWMTLRKIPYGEVRSYQWVADQLGLGKGARAVGNACGRNPLPIVVPCHRVVHQDGTIGGYTGGVEIKSRLLQIEGVQVR